MAYKRRLSANHAESIRLMAPSLPADRPTRGSIELGARLKLSLRASDSPLPPPLNNGLACSSGGLLFHSAGPQSSPPTTGAWHAPDETQQAPPRANSVEQRLQRRRGIQSLKFDQRRPKILGRWFAHHDNGLPTTQIKLILARFYNLSWLRSRLLLLASPPAGAKMNMR